MAQMTEFDIARVAKFLGIDLTEAKRRYEIVQAQADNPDDPICITCARRPEEIDCYVWLTMEEEDVATDEKVRQFVINNEGTYNPRNGHFLCDICYIKNGSPSSPSGWKCP